MNKIFTLCFIEDRNRILLQKREHPPFVGMWNAPGGKLELHESPIEACKREVQEETGLCLLNILFRGTIVISNIKRKKSDAILMLFHSKTYEGNLLLPNEEGEVAWIDVNKVYRELDTPESLFYLLPYILETESTLSGKIVYNDKNLETFDVTM